MTEIDGEGNYYTKGFNSLQKIHSGANSITIPILVKSIFGENKDNTASSLCQSTLGSVTFLSGSLLEEIQQFAFCKCSKLTSIDFSLCTHMTKIHEHAFEDCTTLGTVVFPSSLQELRAYAFQRCYALDTAELKENLKILGMGAFYSCSRLHTVTIADGNTVKEIPRYAFGYSSLTSFIIPQHCNVFNTYAFEGTGSMASISAPNNENFIVKNGALCTITMTNLIYFPPSYTTGVYTMPNVTKISGQAFFRCKATEVIIPNTVTKIDSYSFYNARLRKIVIPDSVTSIGEKSFQTCDLLADVTLSNNLTVLPNDLFRGCSSLQSIEFPESIREIQATCFMGCTKLTEVTLPSNLTKLGGGVFSQCPIKNITFPQDSPFTTDDQFIIYSNNEQDVSQFIDTDKQMDIVLPETVKNIGNSAFAYCKNIVSVSFSGTSQLEKIGQDAFIKCEGLKSFSFPDSLKDIGSSAFKLCSNLTSIHIGKMIEKIGDSVFEECKVLETVIFDDHEADKTLTILKNCFYNSANIKSMTLCEGLIKIGNLFTSSCKDLTEIVLPSTLNTIGEKAFSFSGITKVTFKNDKTALTTIGTKAFSECTKLESFQFLEGVTTIGINAFYKTAFKSLVLPKSVEELQNGCFSCCSNLTSIEQKDGKLSKIGFGVFDDCVQLKFININSPAYVTINGALFNANESSIIVIPPAASTNFYQIPQKVSMISPNAFYGCKNILTITVPDDSLLETIGTLAFADCSNLRTINIPLCVKNIHKDAFKGCKKLNCGQCIINDSKEFRENLVKEAALPRRCLSECAICSKGHENQRYFTYFNLLLVTFVLQ